MTRIAVIDHSTHELYVEDINDGLLNAEPYNGDVQAYIDDNYTFEGDYSWDYIVDSSYEGENDGPYDLSEKIDELREEDLQNDFD